MKPTLSELESLYKAEHLTTRQIGKRFGVSKTQVLRWMKSYGIEPRMTNNAPLYRGEFEHPREELVQLIEGEHVGYREIALKYNVCFSTVANWVNRHNILHPTGWDTRRKGQHPVLPTKEELAELYAQGNSLRSIALQYGVSETTIRVLCARYGVEVRPDGFDGGKRFTCNDDHLVRSLYEQQVDNWLFEHGIDHVLEPILPFDHRSRADFLANGWYIEIWGVTQNEEYKQRRQRKTNLYQAPNLPLIELEVHYFQRRHNRLWARRLAKKLFTPQIF